MGSIGNKTIYAIQHNVTKRIYIGCSVHFEKRIKEHITHLRNGNHGNTELQKDYDLFGEDFSYFVIEKDVSFLDCFDREREWQSILKSNELGKGYNLARRESSPKIEDFIKVDIEIDNAKRKGAKRNALQSHYKQQSSYRKEILHNATQEEKEIKEGKNIQKEVRKKFGDDILYEKFKRLTDERGITAYRVAKDTGISTVVFTDWKTGKSKPKVDKLKKIADYFGVTIEYFLE